MKIRHVKPFEIPRRLLEQKKGWDLSLFYEAAYENPDRWISFMLEKDGTDVGCFILYDDALFGNIAIQTLIIDKAYRSEAIVTEATQRIYESMRAIAKEFGRNVIVAQVSTPEKYMQRLGNPEGLKIREYVIAEEI